MTKRKKYKLIAVAMIAGIVFLFSCTKPTVELLPNIIEPVKAAPLCWQYDHTYETDDTYFYLGEILLPDYVHTDTLIVIDPATLNKEIQREDIESDGDIFEILSRTTRTK